MPCARAGGAQLRDAAERGPRLGGGRQTGVRADPAQAAPGRACRPEPGADQGSRARSPVPAPPVLCLAARCGDYGRATQSLVSVGPGRGGPGRGGWRPARPTHGLRMPVRRGHVAPQNTFLDTIIRKFEGQSEWGRGMLGRGFWGRASSPEYGLGGVPGPCTSPSGNQWGLVASRRWLGVLGARHGAGGCGLWTKGPGVRVQDGKLSSQIKLRRLGTACDTLSVQCTEMGWECADFPNSGCLDVDGAVWVQGQENGYGPNCGTSAGPYVCPP